MEAEMQRGGNFVEMVRSSFGEWTKPKKGRERRAGPVERAKGQCSHCLGAPGVLPGESSQPD